tara:strand:- start:15682 stop:16818 length:1137 start_codon:yes stop_codon:yes gene_type:complete
MSYPLFKVHVDIDEALKQFKDVLESGFINEGEKVLQFQSKLADYFGTSQVVLTNSCTSSLTMALHAAGVTRGDEVITTAMTCVATNMPIMQLGAQPVWADINFNTGNIDPGEVEKLINDKTKAILCVNWAGLPCDMTSLNVICKKYNIKLILDAAHSLGTTYENQDISHYADFTCYSFQAIKHITTGDGGALVVKNYDDYQKAKKLKWFGLDRDSTKTTEGEWKGQRWEWDIEENGYKFNMNNLAAALGLTQIPHLDKIINSHRRNAGIYATQFENSQLVMPLQYPENSEPSFWVYTCIIDESIDRDILLEKLNNVGINAGLVHIPNHNYTCFKGSKKDLPQTEYFNKHQISLPCGWWLESNDIVHIANTLLTLCESC